MKTCLFKHITIPFDGVLQSPFYFSCDQQSFFLPSLIYHSYGNSDESEEESQQFGSQNIMKINYIINLRLSADVFKKSYQTQKSLMLVFQIGEYKFKSVNRRKKRFKSRSSKQRQFNFRILFPHSF